MPKVQGKKAGAVKRAAKKVTARVKSAAGAAKKKVAPKKAAASPKPKPAAKKAAAKPAPKPKARPAKKAVKAVKAVAKAVKKATKKVIAKAAKVAPKKSTKAKLTPKAVVRTKPAKAIPAKAAAKVVVTKTAAAAMKPAPAPKKEAPKKEAPKKEAAKKEAPKAKPAALTVVPKALPPAAPAAAPAPAPAAAPAPAPRAAEAEKKRGRRARPRVTSSGAPAAAWLSTEKPRPASFIPAPARAEAPSAVAAPPASSDRLIRPDDVAHPAVRTVPVRLDIEQAAGRYYVIPYPSEVTVRINEGIEWDFRYLGGADVSVEEIVIEFENPSPFSVATFRTRKPGGARPHRQLSGGALPSAAGKRIQYIVRAFNQFETELANTKTVFVTITA
ncbi:MAG: hypothetical protein M3Q69_07525 [Acidobacteriota bacterium]|nr:hypothetical protein [Acidobacteriota bacterium]